MSDKEGVTDARCLDAKTYLWPAFIWKAEGTQVITLKAVTWGYANFI